MSECFYLCIIEYKYLNQYQNTLMLDQHLHFFTDFKVTCCLFSYVDSTCFRIPPTRVAHNLLCESGKRVSYPVYTYT